MESYIESVAFVILYFFIFYWKTTSKKFVSNSIWPKTGKTLLPAWVAKWNNGIWLICGLCLRQSVQSLPRWFLTSWTTLLHLMYLPEFAVTALSKQIIVHPTPEWTLLLFRRTLKSKMFELQVVRIQQWNDCQIFVIRLYWSQHCRHSTFHRSNNQQACNLAGKKGNKKDLTDRKLKWRRL